MSGGGKTSQASSTASIPPEVMARYNSVNAVAQKVAENPFQSYSSNPNAFVAPLNATQQAGIQNTNTYAGAAQPYFAAATNTLGQAQENSTPYFQAATGYGVAGGQRVDPSQLNGAAVQQYMSPFLNNVYGAALAGQGQQNAQQLSGLRGEAIKSGAFGGDRSGIAAGNLAYQQNLANSQTNANLLNTGYTNALNTAGQQQALGLGAAQANRAALQQASDQMLKIGGQQFNEGASTSQQLAALGSGAQTAGLQGAQAQGAAGATAQQTEQAGKTALYNQFLQEQGYPFQVAQFLANIAMGTGALSGGTTTSTTPRGVLSARGGAINGRAERYSGGLVNASMGGHVYPEHAGEHYAYGGGTYNAPDYMAPNGFGGGGSSFFNTPAGNSAAQSNGFPGFGGVSSPAFQSPQSTFAFPSATGSNSGAGGFPGFPGGLLPSYTSVAPPSTAVQQDFTPFDVSSLRAPKGEMADWQKLIATPPAKLDAQNPAALQAGYGGGQLSYGSEAGGGYSGANDALGGGSTGASNEAASASGGSPDSAAAGFGGGYGGTDGFGGLYRGGRIHKAPGGLALQNFTQATRAGFQDPENNPYGQRDIYGNPRSPKDQSGGPTARVTGGKPVAIYAGNTIPAAPSARASTGVLGGAFGNGTLLDQYRNAENAITLASRDLRGTAADGDKKATSGLFGAGGEFGGEIDGRPGFVQRQISALRAADGGLIGRHHYSTNGRVSDEVERDKKDDDADNVVPTKLDIPVVPASQGLMAPAVTSSGSGSGGSGIGGKLASLGLGAAGTAAFGPVGGFIGSGLGSLLGGLFADGGGVAPHHYAEGGLAGRRGYADGGELPETFTPENADVVARLLARPSPAGQPPLPLGRQSIADVPREDLDAYGRLHLTAGSRVASPFSSALNNRPTFPFDLGQIVDEQERRDIYARESARPQAAPLNKTPSVFDGSIPAPAPGGLGGASQPPVPFPENPSEGYRFRAGSPAPADLVPIATGSAAPAAAGDNNNARPPSRTIDQIIATGNAAAAPVANASQQTGLAAAAPAADAPQKAGLAAGTLDPNPYQTLQQQPLNWFQRNQDILRAVAGGVASGGNALTLPGFLARGIAGAAQGFGEGQKDMNALAAQMSETNALPQRVENERARLAADLLAKTGDRFSPAYNPETGSLIGFHDKLQPGRVLSQSEVDAIRLNVARTANAPPSVLAAFTAGAPPGAGGASPPGTSGAPPPGAGQPIDYKSAPTVSGRDRDAMIRTVIGEARGQGPEGMKAVAHTIYNRSAISGKTAYDTVRAPGQFEPWQTRAAELDAIDPNSDAYKRAAQAVDAALSNPGSDPTGGSTLFLSPSVMQSRGAALPSWAQGKPSAVIGGHNFYTGAFSGSPQVGDTGAGYAPIAAVTKPASTVFTDDPYQGQINDLLNTQRKLSGSLLNSQSPQSNASITSSINTNNEVLRNLLTQQQGWQSQQSTGYIKTQEDTIAFARVAQDMKGEALAALDLFKKNPNTGTLATYIQKYGSALQQIGVPPATLNNLLGTNPADLDKIQKLVSSLAAQAGALSPSLVRTFEATASQYSSSIPSIQMQQAAALFAFEKIILPKIEHNIKRADVLDDKSVLAGDNIGLKKALFRYDQEHPIYTPDPVAPKNAPGAPPGATHASPDGKRFFKIEGGKTVEVFNAGS